MTITFESDMDIIVYALEKIESYAREKQYIFLAQTVLWISSIIGLREGLGIHINNLNVQSNIGNPAVRVEPLSRPELPGICPSRVASIRNSDSEDSASEHESIITTETEIHDEVIDNCEAFLEQSKQERKALRVFTRQASRVVKIKADKKKSVKTFETQTERIDNNKLLHRNAAGE
jgi:hypothetical protein